jgi:hypothetical protein
MSSLDELLYKEKYLKYKNKYIQLKEYQGGGFSLKDVKDVLKKTRKGANTVATKVATKASEAKTGANTVATKVATKASEAKTGATKILFPTAYIFAKTSDIIPLRGNLKENISNIKIILNKKGYIIKSDDPLQMIMIGSKSDLSKKFYNAVNSTNDFVYGNKTFEGQIKKISNCTQTNMKDINLILNNNDAILNNTVLTNINKIKVNESNNINYINIINKTLFDKNKNENKNKKLSRNVGTSHSTDIINLQHNLFKIDHNDTIINEIKKLVYNQLVKTDNQLVKTDNQLVKTDNQLEKTDNQLEKTNKQKENEIDITKEISYMYIKYNNVYNSEADIIFDTPDQPEQGNDQQQATNGQPNQDNDKHNLDNVQAN